MSSLIGQAIKLRALEPDDLEVLYSWENNESYWQFGQTLKPFSKDVLVKYLNASHLDIFEAKQVRFTIESLITPIIPLGFIDLFDFDPQNNRAGVGILIGKEDFRNKGYGIDALETLCNYAFKTLLLNQLYCSVRESNKAGISLFSSAGFKSTGVRENWIKTSNGWENELFFQLLVSDWLNSKE
ncbi:MAG: GNAT family N-acetyltransferase [Bacteroidales bacterium]|nr:GNAT family N-acetyltransferase [Bacteroidales bacterium]